MLPDNRNRAYIVHNLCNGKFYAKAAGSGITLYTSNSRTKCYDVANKMGYYFAY